MSDTAPNASVIYRHDVTEQLSIVRVRPDEGPVPEFDPGQFIMVGLPPDHHSIDPTTAPNPEQKQPRLFRRSYSIASPAANREYVELFVALVEQGKLTSRLWTVKEGGRVWLSSKPGGKFTLADVPADQNIIAVATGTGVSPYMSMLRTYAGHNRWRRFCLIHGVRQSADLGYREELEALAAQTPDFHYIPTVTRDPETSGFDGHRGRPLSVIEDGTYEAVTGAALDPLQTHAMLCGSPEMVEDMILALETHGFVQPKRQVPGNIHFERYW